MSNDEVSALSVRARVVAQLDAAGLSPSSDEIDALAKGAVGMAAGVASLWALAESRYEEPALIFDPDPHVAPWR